MVNLWKEGSGHPSKGKHWLKKTDEQCKRGQCGRTVAFGMDTHETYTLPSVMYTEDVKQRLLQTACNQWRQTNFACKLCFQHKQQTTATLIPWSRVLLQKLAVAHLAKKLPVIYWTRMFITVFTRAHHWSLLS